MTRALLIAATVAGVFAIACSARDAAEPTRQPTASPTATSTAVRTLVPPTPPPTATRTPSPTPMPTATPVPASIQYTFDDDVDPREQALIQLGVRAGEDYANDHFGGAASRTVFVHVANDNSCINGATAIGYEICVNAGSDAWIALSPDYLKLKVLAHEYFHVWQHDLFCYREPEWLYEGMAEWYGYQAIVSAGLVDPVAASVERQVLLQQEPIHTPLSEQESATAAPQPAEYALWSFAAQRLMSGHNDADVRTFCAGKGEGLTWQESFEEAFGMSVEDWYMEFEEWRAGFLPYSGVG